MDDGIKKIIGTLENIYNSNLMDDVINDEIVSSIRKINSLYENQTIKVAILGEFSSGKSTFINALLSEEILTSGDAPTTAVNTHIIYKEKNSVSIEFQDGSEKLISLNKLNKYLTSLTDSKECSRINIGHNNKVLKEGIELIDTPGANVDINSHNIQRNKAIEEASVGIFLMSVQNLASKSFVGFLKDNEKNIHKFLFIITKCDLIATSIDTDGYYVNDNAKLESIYEYVYKIITNHTKIRNPEIHMISSKAFLEGKTFQFMNVEENFMCVEKSIHFFATKYKTRIIYNEVLITLALVLNEIKLMINDKTKFYKTELERIKMEISSFEKILGSLEENWNRSLSGESIKNKNEIRKIISSCREIIYCDLKNQMEEIKSFAEFKKKADSIGEKLTANYRQKCYSFINYVVENYGSKEIVLVEKTIKEYFDKIEEAYNYLGITQSNLMKSKTKFVKDAIVVFAIMELIGSFFYNGFDLFIISIIALSIIAFLYKFVCSPKNINFNISFDKYFHDIGISNLEIEYAGKNSYDQAAGLTGGAIMGGLIGGPIGAVIGAGLGMLAGVVSSESRLEKAKATFVEAFENHITILQEKIQQEAFKTIEKKEVILRKGYYNYIADYKILQKDLLLGIENHNQSLYIKYGESYNSMKSFSALVGTHLRDVQEKLMLISKQ